MGSDGHRVRGFLRGQQKHSGTRQRRWYNVVSLLSDNELLNGYVRLFLSTGKGEGK